MHVHNTVLNAQLVVCLSRPENYNGQVPDPGPQCTQMSAFTLSKQLLQVPGVKDTL
jgi:hypothetical protein